MEQIAWFGQASRKKYKQASTITIETVTGFFVCLIKLNLY